MTLMCLFIPDFIKEQEEQESNNDLPYNKYFMNY